MAEPKTCPECGQIPSAVHDYDGDPRRCSWCGTIVPGRELPQTVEQWLAGGGDVPEVGRGSGRVLSGTTGELAACVGHLAACDTCRLPAAADGIVSMSMAEDGHVRFAVEGREVRQGPPLPAHRAAEAGGGTSPERPGEFTGQ